jgi:hypothetical protein
MLINLENMKETVKHLQHPPKNLNPKLPKRCSLTISCPQPKIFSLSGMIKLLLLAKITDIGRITPVIPRPTGTETKTTDKDCMRRSLTSLLKPSTKKTTPTKLLSMFSIASWRKR